MTSFKDGPLLYVTDKKVSTPKSVDSPNEANLWRKWWPLKMWIATLHQTFSSFWCFGKLLHKNIRTTLLKLHNTRRCVGIFDANKQLARRKHNCFYSYRNVGGFFLVRGASFKQEVAERTSLESPLLCLSAISKTMPDEFFIQSKSVFTEKSITIFTFHYYRLQLLHKRRNYN